MADHKNLEATTGGSVDPAVSSGQPLNKQRRRRTNPINCVLAVAVPIALLSLLGLLLFKWLMPGAWPVYLALPDGCVVVGKERAGMLYLDAGDQPLEIECTDNAYEPPRVTVHQVRIRVEEGENYASWDFGEPRIFNDVE